MPQPAPHACFTHNFVRNAGESHWTTTELADMVLARMGVADRSIEWLIDAWGVPPEENAFLKSCVQSSDDEDPRTSLQRRSLLKSLWWTKSRSRSQRLGQPILKEPTFCAIIGLDPRAESLGVEGYAKHFLGRAFKRTEVDDPGTNGLRRR